jgi:hypothetical protein
LKYLFLTVLHNLKLEGELNKGKEILPGTRISNNSTLVKEVLESILFKEVAGFHSIDEFANSVYLYKRGDFDLLKVSSQEERHDSDYTFYFLREAQFFVNELWKMKDNSVYVRDGFLILYEDDIENGITYKGALSSVNSNSQGEIIETLFTNEQIDKVIRAFVEDGEIPSIDNFIEGGKTPNKELFFKGSIRAERAFYFILDARRASHLPIKIVSYCTALECFFTTDNTEVNYKIAERVALLLGTSSENKKELFNTTKKAYGIRSKIIHGSSLKEKEGLLKELSVKLDDILREIISKDIKEFVLEDNKLSEYFLDRLFNDSIPL